MQLSLPGFRQELQDSPPSTARLFQQIKYHAVRTLNQLTFFHRGAENDVPVHAHALCAG
jgi:hypothetical protein